MTGTKDAPPEYLKDFTEKMRQLYQEAEKVHPKSKYQTPETWRAEVLTELNRQKVINLETKAKIYSKSKGKV